MTVTYNINAEDLRAFNKYARLKTPQGIRIRIISTVLLFLFSVIMTSTFPSESYIVRIVFLLVIFGIMLLGAEILNRIFLRIAFWRMFTPEKQKGVLCEHTITLTDEWLIETTSINEDKKKWSGIYKVVSTKDYIYIFLTSQMAHIIHKRSFSSPELAELFFKEASELHTKAMTAIR